MSRYAENTQVSSDRSRAEIERTLSRYGATSFMYGWQESHALVAFEVRERRIRFLLPMPDRADFRFTPSRRTLRSTQQRDAEYERAIRQRWRALALVIKAKLEAVEAGVAEFEEEFLAHIMLPDGTTVGQSAIPAIAHAYQTGKMQPLLPHFGD